MKWEANAMPELRLEGKALEEAKTSGIAEAAKLLALAEKLEQVAERHDARVIRTSFALLGIAAALTVLGLILLILVSAKVLAGGDALWMFLVGALEAAVGAAYCWQLRVTAARNRENERYLMQRLVDMLREIEGTFALDETVSVLERVEFQTRLSRFGIGPGTRGTGTTPS
jgi:hypothetical protein